MYGHPRAVSTWARSHRRAEWRRATRSAARTLARALATAALAFAFCFAVTWHYLPEHHQQQEHAP